ncbi:MAG: hypothetical protein PUA83_06395 [Clostridiales bacterium]|nr:hypothetical protein [Clostridiales bacterium]
MKKLIAVILAVLMLASLAACAGEEGNDTSSDVTTAGETTTAADTSAEDTSDTEATTDASSGNPGSADGTFGEILKDDFVAIMADGSLTSAYDIAEKLSTNENILFMPMAMEVEPGYLSGFTTEITGFESGATFGPIIGSIPFVGYVFQLADDADVDAFMDTLESSADLRWNICVTADEMVVEHVGNTVFFVMCPASAE